VTTPVWRSMVGFDLQQSLASYHGLGWMRHLPGQIGTQQSFLSFQWLMQYNFEGLSNNMCNWNFAEGSGPVLRRMVLLRGQPFRLSSQPLESLIHRQLEWTGLLP